MNQENNKKINSIVKDDRPRQRHEFLKHLYGNASHRVSDCRLWVKLQVHTYGM